jgi:hypothetical protein
MVCLGLLGLLGLEGKEVNAALEVNRLSIIITGTISPLVAMLSLESPLNRIWLITLRLLVMLE